MQRPSGGDCVNVLMKRDVHEFLPTADIQFGVSYALLVNIVNFGMRASTSQSTHRVRLHPGAPLSKQCQRLPLFIWFLFYKHGSDFG